VVVSRKPKTGRPPRAGGVADQLLQIRMTGAELAAIDKAATRLGLDRSTWIREAIDVKLGETSESPRGEIMRACAEVELLLERIRDAV
jgi:hypothetical protein